MLHREKAPGVRYIYALRGFWLMPAVNPGCPTLLKQMRHWSLIEIEC
jgi:hypothetical protein